MHRHLRAAVSLAIFAVIGIGQTAPVAAQQPESYDIVVYGGTSAGVMAAVQAKKMGRTVILVSPDKHLGGLSSSGLGRPERWRPNAIGGLARAVSHRSYPH